MPKLPHTDVMSDFSALFERLPVTVANYGITLHEHRLLDDWREYGSTDSGVFLVAKACLQSVWLPALSCDVPCHCAVCDVLAMDRAGNAIHAPMACSSVLACATTMGVCEPPAAMRKFCMHIHWAACSWCSRGTVSPHAWHETGADGMHSSEFRSAQPISSGWAGGSCLLFFCPATSRSRRLGSACSSAGSARAPAQAQPNGTNLGAAISLIQLASGACDGCPKKAIMGTAR